MSFIICKIFGVKLLYPATWWRPWRAAGALKSPPPILRAWAAGLSVITGLCLGATQTQAATYTVTFTSLSFPTFEGTLTVPDALIGPSHANAFIPSGQFTSFSATVNSTTFNLPGDEVTSTGGQVSGLWLDSAGQPLALSPTGTGSPMYINDNDTPLTGSTKIRPYLTFRYSGVWRYTNFYDKTNNNLKGRYTIGPASTPYTISASNDTSKPLTQRILICYSAPSTASSNVLKQSLVPLDPDCATYGDMKIASDNAGKVASRFSRALALVPSSIVSGPKEAAQDLVLDSALKRMPGPVKTILSKLNSILSYAKDNATGVAQFYIGNATQQLSQVSRIHSVYGRDPPSPDYQTVVQRSGIKIDAGFVTKFGEHYLQADIAFRQLAYALESRELALISLERMQGALLAGDNTALSMQAAATAEYFKDVDVAVQEAQTALTQLGATFRADGGANPLFDLSLLKKAKTFLRQNGLSPDFRLLLKTGLGLSDRQIATAINDVYNIDASTVVAPAGLSFRSMPSELAKAISRMKVSDLM